jgi:hypothetical protein
MITELISANKHRYSFPKLRVASSILAVVTKSNTFLLSKILLKYYSPILAVSSRFSIPHGETRGDA